MPVLFQFSPELNLIYYAAFGYCTTDHFFDTVLQTIQLKLDQGNFRVIFDVRSTTEIDFVANDFKRVVEIVSIMKKNNLVFEKTAIITRSDFADNFINALSLFLIDHPMKIKVFKFSEEATTWLGLSGAENEVLGINHNLHQEFLIDQKKAY
jgi:hypothetical protein